MGNILNSCSQWTLSHQHRGLVGLSETGVVGRRRLFSLFCSSSIRKRFSATEPISNLMGFLRFFWKEKLLYFIRKHSFSLKTLNVAVNFKMKFKWISFLKMSSPLLSLRTLLVKNHKSFKTQKIENYVEETEFFKKCFCFKKRHLYQERRMESRLLVANSLVTIVVIASFERKLIN